MKRTQQFTIKKMFIISIVFFGNPFLIEANCVPSKCEQSLITNIPGASSFFVGRQENLKELRTKLENQKEQSVVAIVGMAGMGKTQLARKYAHTFARDYDVIWWMDTNQDLLPQIRELGQKLNLIKGCPIPSINERMLEKWIDGVESCCKEHSLGALLIMDDVKEKKSITPVVQALKNTPILLTSRNQSIGESNMPLECFTREESIEYLKASLSENSQDSLDLLAATLNDYPLALAQAATYLGLFPSLSVEEYLRLYKEKRKALWKEEEQVLPQKNGEQKRLDYSHTVSSTFMLLLEQIKASPHAFELLKFSSLLGSQDIPKRLLKDWMLDYRQVNDFDFHKALSSLITLSIFEKSKDKEEKENYFNIHELLQDFIRDSLDKEEREYYLKELTNLVSTYLPESSHQLWKVLFKDRHLEFHLQSLLRFADQYNLQSDELLKLKIKHLHFLYFFKSDYPTVSAKINELEKEVNNNNSISPLDKGRFLILFANFTALGSNCEKATSISEEAEKLLTNIQLQEAREELFFLLVNNLMDFYNLKGDLKKAEGAARKAEHLLPHISNVNYIALYYFIRAAQLLNKGDYTEALRHIDLSIEKLPATDFPPYVHFFKKVFKAEILAKLGELEKASMLAEANYKGLKKVYPHEANYKILKTEIALAFIYLKQGKLEKSFHFLTSVMSGLNTFYKKPYESPLQGGPHILLGEIYEKQNDFLKALSEYKKAEEIYNNIFSTIEVDDMSYLYKNLSILGEKLRDDFITQTYFQLLLKYFGRDHFRTQEVVDYLETRNRQVPWSKL
ncbi:MAG TPA: NB-ARC domain-containing protein [Alphaproteobacteria bacterium]|nr:NB-ARC domain-containing protein [Alphaproteobacteria bacterium]